MIQNDLDSLYIGTILKGDQFNGTDIFFYSLDSDNNQETNEGTEDQKRIPCDMMHSTDYYYIERVGYHIFDDYDGGLSEVEYFVSNDTINEEYFT